MLELLIILVSRVTHVWLFDDIYHLEVKVSNGQGLNTTFSNTHDHYHRLWTNMTVTIYPCT